MYVLNDVIQQILTTTQKYCSGNIDLGPVSPTRKTEPQTNQPREPNATTLGGLGLVYLGQVNGQASA